MCSSDLFDLNGQKERERGQTLRRARSSQQVLPRRKRAGRQPEGKAQWRRVRAVVVSGGRSAVGRTPWMGRAAPQERGPRCVSGRVGFSEGTEPSSSSRRTCLPQTLVLGRRRFHRVWSGCAVKGCCAGQTERASHPTRALGSRFPPPGGLFSHSDGSFSRPLQAGDGPGGSHGSGFVSRSHIRLFSEQLRCAGQRALERGGTGRNHADPFRRLDLGERARVLPGSG